MIHRNKEREWPRNDSMYAWDKDGEGREREYGEKN
jgi:hypothetical protein